MESLTVAPESSELLRVLTAGADAIEQALIDREQVDCPVTHRFGPGVYIREVLLPAGAIVVGHHQNFPHMNNMVKGRVATCLPDGRVVELCAPWTGVFPAGRKVSFVYEDVVWQNIYATDETDVEVLEATFLTKSMTWQAAQAVKQATATLRCQEDRDDYAEYLRAAGIDDATLRALSEDPATHAPHMPYGSFGVRIGASHIDGRGVLASQPFASGDCIAPLAVAGMRTPVGRWVNHAKFPNAEIRHDGAGNYALFALTDIIGCRGGEDGDEITCDYRHMPPIVRALAEEETTCLA